MDAKTAASAYRESAYDNAPPLKIVHMLYGGALRFLEQAEAIDPEQDPHGFNDRLGRADGIVSELRLSLDHEKAPEVCRELSSLYLFVEDQVRRALLDHDVSAIRPARDVLATLDDAWRKIDVDPGQPRS